LPPPPLLLEPPPPAGPGAWRRRRSLLDELLDLGSLVGGDLLIEHVRWVFLLLEGILPIWLSVFLALGLQKSLRFRDRGGKIVVGHGRISFVRVKRCRSARWRPPQQAETSVRMCMSISQLRHDPLRR
jgi:hypothetical protein